jgi:hypothetical protein
MRAYARAQRTHEVKSLRYQVLSAGYDPYSRTLFEEAERKILSRDERAWYYRLILDLVDGLPTRVPYNPEQPIGDCRTIIFPEPNRRSHIDTTGRRRRGDYFVLRHPFEWPAVPIAAYYRVQLLGVMILGEPLLLKPQLTKRQLGELYVNLPSCPFHPRGWQFKTWGSKEMPLHRMRQKARRKEEKEERLAMLYAIANDPRATRPKESKSDAPYTDAAAEIKPNSDAINKGV